MKYRHCHFAFGFCILTFWHLGQIHFRFLWNIWPFNSFIAPVHRLQVMMASSSCHDPVARMQGSANVTGDD